MYLYIYPIDLYYIFIVTKHNVLSNNPFILNKYHIHILVVVYRLIHQVHILSHLLAFSLINLIIIIIFTLIYGYAVDYANSQVTKG